MASFLSFMNCGQVEFTEEDGCTCVKRPSVNELKFEPRDSYGSYDADGKSMDMRPTIMDSGAREDEMESTRDGASDDGRKKGTVCSPNEQPRDTLATHQAVLSEQNLKEYDSQVLEFEDDDRTSVPNRGVSIVSSQCLGSMLEAEEKNCETFPVELDLSKGKLGLEITAMRNSVHVWKIQENPMVLVNAHNKANPSKQIQVGDQIVSVNGETKPKQIAVVLKDAYKAKKTASLVIRKRMRNFTVCLQEMAAAPKLGFICKLKGPSVCIQNVKKGLIHSWSEKHPQRCVCVGDEIVEVNGEKGEKIAEKLTEWVHKHDENLYLSIQASGGPGNAAPAAA